MISKNTIFTLALALAMILSAAAASADVVSFGDSTKHWPGWGTPQENGKDVIGIPDFTGGTATFDTSNPSMFTLTSASFTLNPGGNASLYNSLTSGDLFINTGKDTTWDYVVRLGSGGSASVYSVNLGLTDPNGYDLGTASGNFRDNHPAWAKLDGLSPVAVASWSGLPDWNGGAAGTVSITGLDIDFTTLSLAYTISCANDVVLECAIAKTPIPGAVWLLGSGLMGLIGLRKRMIRA